MEMPTPCPSCGLVVELNDMNACRDCRYTFCGNCLEDNFGLCEMCLVQHEGEDVDG